MDDSQSRRQRLGPDTDGRYRIDAPCKLNLGLRIFPARPDGFHDLESWMVPISWHDTLTYEPGGPARLAITGRTEGIPMQLDKNLVGRAMLKLAAAAGREASGQLTLHKVVPPGGGLGGGSSDAAHALVLLDVAWNVHLDTRTLVALAVELGSDVPFFVQAQPALCKGRGEIMTPLRPFSALYAVLIIPQAGLATKPVFQAFDAGHRADDEAAEFRWTQCAGMPAEELNVALHNDLEIPAFYLAPWLSELRDRAMAAAGQKVHMTGSGSTLFTLCDTGPRAGDLAERLGDCLSTGTTCVPVRILGQRE